MGRGARTRPRNNGPRRHVLKEDTADSVDPKLLEKYRVTRQADKKRELFRMVRTQTKDAKRSRREKREREKKVLKEKAPLKLIPKTKERLRKPDETFVEEDNDAEIVKDEADDEFAAFFKSRENPRVLITTGERPSFRTKLFVKEAKWLFPNSIYRPRKDYTLKEITQFCINRKFTDLLVVTERLKEPHNIIISHLPEGPTATFRVSNFLAHKQLENVAERTEHYPELNFKNFDTRLGRRIGRMLQCLFPAKRDYAGRAIATFHNQRDYVFLRVHRYMFDSMSAVRIQEMGPRFTLRLLSLQSGTFDTQFGEYEWFRKKEHDEDKLQWFM
jgi:ribosome production factor 1